ncbi:DUF3231 family protein [Neobacillus mesonae]|uniref:DUF3231 family protein n=1 Tax=Neobacillus mesonae TaxID=1193713 RepID=UPI002E226257|nr:DUF3231 family protein [Neobacillus mesonae]
MDDKTRIQLTAAEMSGLWSQYINDSLATCVNRYFLEKVEDEEVRPIVEWVIRTAKENLAIVRAIFQKEDFPIPIGFSEQDVNPQAPKLFSDTFVLIYLRQMSIMALTANSAALGLVTRPDVIDFHKRIVDKAIDLQDQTRDLMLKQGTYVRPPYISVPDKVDFIEKQSFLTGFFGKKRSFTSIEITHLFLNVQTNAIGKALITGLAQTAQDKEVKQFLLRGMQLSQKFVEIFSRILINEDLPAPMNWDSAVTDSTTPVFSDKLIMFHVSAMIAAGIGNFGMAMAASPRRDLGARYASLIPEISLYAEDAANLMIKHGWLEEPPQADNRDELIKGE